MDEVQKVAFTSGPPIQLRSADLSWEGPVRLVHT